MDYERRTAVILDWLRSLGKTFVNQVKEAQEEKVFDPRAHILEN